MSFFDHNPEPPKTVTLFSAGLLSKWGFCDGDLLEWLSEFGRFDRRDVLCAVVRAKLIPVLKQTVEIEEVVTIHNPIRVRTVNGVNVTEMHYSADAGDNVLTPASVDVSGEEVLRIAREIGDQGQS